jgi:hypothetical protein
MRKTTLVLALFVTAPAWAGSVTILTPSDLQQPNLSIIRTLGAESEGKISAPPDAVNWGALRQQCVGQGGVWDEAIRTCGGTTGAQAPDPTDCSDEAYYKPGEGCVPFSRLMEGARPKF